MSEQMIKLTSAASLAANATADMIQAVDDGEFSPVDDIGTGDTLTLLTDGLRLLIEAMDDPNEDRAALHAATLHYLERISS